MSRDEHKMPLPDARLLPIAIGECGETVDRDGGEIEFWVDPEFFVHAANHIMPCRDIVRRLAENEEMRADEWVRLIVDAKELWAEMKGGEE